MKRQRAKRRKEIKEQYTRILGSRGSWNTYLQIDQQGFLLVGPTGIKQATWVANMITAALERLIEREAKERSVEHDSTRATGH